MTSVDFWLPLTLPLQLPELLLLSISLSMSMPIQIPILFLTPMKNATHTKLKSIGMNQMGRYFFNKPIFRTMLATSN